MKGNFDISQRMMNSSSSILCETKYSWGSFIGVLLSTTNRLYLGWFGILVFPLLSLGAISTALGAGVHTQIGGASAEVWWRRQNVNYASNEVYIDIVEAIDCICDGNGHMVAGGVHGEIQVNSKLSGLPEVLLTMRNP